MTPDEFKKWRKQLGWTQTEAAEQLGLTRRTIYCYESGTTSRGRVAQPIPRRIVLAARFLAEQERAA